MLNNIWQKSNQIGLNWILLQTKIYELENKKKTLGLSKAENAELEKSTAAYFEIDAILEKFGWDSIGQLKSHIQASGKY